MFAFSIYDARSQRVLLARDHMGIKPLYHGTVPGRGIVWASEVRSLLASELGYWPIDSRGLAGFLAYGAVQEPLTIARGVCALPPGSWMEVHADGEICARGMHWSLPNPCLSAHAPGEKELVEEGKALLHKAVKRHLLADVPIGVFLSSGLDSTALVGIAKQNASQQIQAFTISFGDHPDIDEAPMARDIAKRLGVAHNEHPIDSRTALDWTQQWLDILDQPAMDGLNTYIVARAVRQHGIVVALSGLGGDELFGGYRTFDGIPRWSRRLRWLKHISPKWRSALAGVAARSGSSVYRGKAMDTLRSCAGVRELYFQYRRLLCDADLAALGFDAAELQLTPSFHALDTDIESLVMANDPIASISRLECAFYMQNMLLRDSDVFGMANSLEIRVPFLDKDLVEWAFRLPGSSILPEGKAGKYLLRKICGELYATAGVSQIKRGFTLPYQNWMMGPLRGVMEDSLAFLKTSGLMEARGVDFVRNAFLGDPKGSAWSRVWALVALGRWLERCRCNTSSTRMPEASGDTCGLSGPSQMVLH